MKNERGKKIIEKDTFMTVVDPKKKYLHCKKKHIRIFTKPRRQLNDTKF